MRVNPHKVLDDKSTERTVDIPVKPIKKVFVQYHSWTSKAHEAFYCRQKYKENNYKAEVNAGVTTVLTL